MIIWKVILGIFQYFLITFTQHKTKKNQGMLHSAWGYFGVFVIHFGDISPSLKNLKLYSRYIFHKNYCFYSDGLCLEYFGVFWVHFRVCSSNSRNSSNIFIWIFVQHLRCTGFIKLLSQVKFSTPRWPRYCMEYVNMFIFVQNIYLFLTIATFIYSFIFLSTFKGRLSARRT